VAVQLHRYKTSGAMTLTPLIDVVFLLLIFFLVATQFAEEERQLKLELPSASEALPLMVEPSELIINVDRQGRYFIEGKFRLVEEVERILQQAAVHNGFTQNVIVRADRAADWQSVLTVINLCKKVGLNDPVATIADEE
jgi:biopolymer transport protein ExbD